MKVIKNECRKIKLIRIIVFTFVMSIIVSCAKQEDKQETILIAAAASLENIFKNQLIPLFEEKNPQVKIEGVYDSSGKLQTQIEEGLHVDIFMSAAVKQMDAMTKNGYILEDTIVNLLENKLVFIVPKGFESGYEKFEDIVNSECIALGDPESVPAGQYAKEALISLDLWEKVEGKASFGSNVTEVLNWVAEGSADSGIVYMTDAKMSKDVTIIEEIRDDILKDKVIYPVAILKNSDKQEMAQLFLDFLKSEEALLIFKEYGFSYDGFS